MSNVSIGAGIGLIHFVACYEIESIKDRNLKIVRELLHEPFVGCSHCAHENGVDNNAIVSCIRSIALDRLWP